MNPIIRLDGKDANGRTVDGRDLVPEDLKLVHAEDFRDMTQYTERLQTLVRQLAEDLPPVGKLVAVPELPPGYRAQPERLRALRDLLLIDLHKPVVVSGATARVGLQGMGGIGKSVLANALAHHPEVQRAFKDNIFWISLGQTPRIEDLLRWLARQLGDEGDFADTRTGKEKLRELLSERAALLILDDVWERHHAEAFNVVGPLGRILLTTRDAGLVTALAAQENHYRVELPTLAEAETLLAAAAEVAPEALPPEAHEIITQCDRLPLALALCGGMVHGGTAWPHVLEALREHDLEFLSEDHPSEEHHRNAWVAMDASLRVLTQDQRDRFAELAVFALDTAVPEAAVAVLWGHTAGMVPRHVAELLAQFTRRALLQEVRAVDGVPGGWDLHDLLHNFAEGMAIKRMGSTTALHRKLLDAYRTKSPDGWHAGPNDGYFLQRLCGHMIAATEWDELEALLTDLSFLELKVQHGLAFGLIRDFADVVRHLPKERPQHRIMGLLEEASRRDIHFIHDHREEYPQALFQCLWNAGWWYDSMETSEHYEQPTEGWNEGNAAWLRPGPKLHELLEHWRFEREAMSPGFVWVKSLRPPFERLASGLQSILRAHEKPVVSVAFSPDGTLVASASGDATVRVWDVESAEERNILTGHEKYAIGLAFSADGTLVASGSGDGAVRIWDTSDGHMRAILLGHMRRVTSLVFSPDSRLIASGSDDTTVRLWDVESGEERVTLKGHDEEVSSVAFSPDGGSIASASRDKTLKVWDLATGAGKVILRGEESFTSMAYSPDGSCFAIGSTDGTVRVCETNTGRERLLLAGHWLLVYSVAWSPDGALIATGGHDHTVRVWDAITGEERSILRGHTAEVTSVAFSPSGGSVASGSMDQTVRLWDLDSDIFGNIIRGHKKQITEIAVSNDGGYIASGSFDTTLRVWDSGRGHELFVFSGHDGYVGHVCFSPDAQRVASTGSWDPVRLWNLQTQDVQELRGEPDTYDVLVISPDGVRLAGASLRVVRLWRIDEADADSQVLPHAETVSVVAFSPNSEWVVTASADYSLRIWNSRTCKQQFVLGGHRDRITGIAFTPDGTTIASGSNDGTIHLWDARSGRCLSVLMSPAGQISSVAFASNKSLLVGVARYGILCLWDLSASLVAEVELCSGDALMAVAHLEKGVLIPQYQRNKSRTVWIDPVSMSTVAIMVGDLVGPVAGVGYANASGGYLSIVQVEGDWRSRMCHPDVPQWKYILEKHGKPFEQLKMGLDWPEVEEQSHHVESEANKAIAFSNSAQDYRKRDELEWASFLLRRAISIEDHKLASDHPKRAHRRNNLALVLLVANKLSRVQSVVSEAWQLKQSGAGGHDRTSGRILCVRLALLWLEAKGGEFALGQLRTLLLNGELPIHGGIDLLWDVEDVLVGLQPRLSPEQHRFLVALVAALNDQKQVPKLDEFEFWRSQSPIPLDASWL